MSVSAPPGYTVHHRKRQADGGDDSERNRIFVPETHHPSWNLLFDGYPVEKIALLLERYWARFGEGKAVLMARQIVLDLLASQENKKNKKLFKAKGLRQIRDLMQISKSEAKKLCAWILLFDDRPLVEIIEIVNHVWLDLDFEIYTKSGTTKILVRKRQTEI